MGGIREMKKIGIVSMYYRNFNYGGVLQAYALCRLLDDTGYDVEQIAYQYAISKQNETLLDKFRRKGFSLILEYAKNKLFYFKNKKKIKVVTESRELAFVPFLATAIKHSDIVYSNKTIHECQDKYDVFISGSDQVWNGYNYVYYLDFVNNGRKKISYAASISREYLTEREENAFKESLSSYTAISVREENDKKLLSKIIQKSVKVVLDPTLLLEKSDWNILTSKRLCEDKYIFCYFLGNNSRARKIAYQLKKKKGYKIISIPMYRWGLFQLDLTISDKVVYDASPNDFLSYIKNAEYVITDSFHAMVFSNIFEKEYFVFNRNRRGEMNTRIVNLTTILGTENRFCNTNNQETLQYVLNQKPINYNNTRDVLTKQKQDSKEYLFECLG